MRWGPAAKPSSPPSPPPPPTPARPIFYRPGVGMPSTSEGVDGACDISWERTAKATLIIGLPMVAKQRGDTHSVSKERSTRARSREHGQKLRYCPQQPSAPLNTPVPIAKPELAPAPNITPKPLILKPIAAVPPPPPALVNTIPEPEQTLKASPTPEAEQVASIPPKGGGIKTGKAIRVIFNPRGSKLPRAAKVVLKEVADKLKVSTTLRLQLQAYAGGASMSSSKARRVSLSRALSIRSFLIESGVKSTRIDVRALGNKSNEEPINRVDVNLVER